MERLVTDLLRLARLDANQEPLEMTNCDIERMFRTVVTDLAPSIAGKDQHVTVVVATEAGVVQADPTKLHDIVRNLVENAVNYSPERASVRLEAHRRRRVGGDRGLRLGSGYSTGRPHPRLRTLLPGGQSSRSSRGHWARPRHRSASGRAARRHCEGGERVRRRSQVHSYPASPA